MDGWVGSRRWFRVWLVLIKVSDKRRNVATVDVGGEEDIYIRYMAIFGHMVVIQYILQTSNSEVVVLIVSMLLRYYI